LTALFGRPGREPRDRQLSPHTGYQGGFIEGTTDYSLIVGAKGSPSQLVLNVVFRMDLPTPNIPSGLTNI